MPDFVMPNREYLRIHELLVMEAPGFGASEEYRRLGSADLVLPSVVCGAFTRYVERLHSDIPRSAGLGGDVLVEEAFRAIERLASSSDAEVVNTVVVEIFEHLHLSEQATNTFRSRLGPSARALYERWIAPGAGSGKGSTS